MTLNNLLISRIRESLLAGLTAAALAGCATAPDSNIQTPLSARPTLPPVPQTNNGSIFQPARSLALFEDRRARYVGDVLTVNLVERSTAIRSNQTKESREGVAEVDIPTPTILGKKPPFPFNGASTWNSDSSTTQTFADNDSKSNTITGSITVTVVDVLENGNLRVAGEKQLAVNNDTDYIRIAGVVNPSYISTANTINSTQLADVQIESKNSQSLDKSQLTSMLARFFLTILPF